MPQPEPPDPVSMPALLRHALVTYGGAMRAALAKAGYDDIPKNGLYVIGGLALAGDHPLGGLIDQLRLSKQAAGQLVDTLVERGYLQRNVDAEDRRRLTIALSSRGRAAAKVQGAARVRIDEVLTARVGERNVESARRALIALIQIGRELK
ncbi:MAG TPA: MarR family transcriptional regulator [Steroidobacteraceae bacterium]|jgi:DNA-binding MarR family transcriptional regulator|nr:MarR family transcriptional regulator [Steroidobacteraceae bacterium]